MLFQTCITFYCETQETFQKGKVSERNCKRSQWWPTFYFSQHAEKSSFVFHRKKRKATRTWRWLHHCRTFTSSLIFLILLMVVRTMIRILSSVAVGRLMLMATRAAIERQKIREECIFLKKNESYCHMSRLIVCRVSKCLKNLFS